DAPFPRPAAGPSNRRDVSDRSAAGDSITGDSFIRTMLHFRTHARLAPGFSRIDPELWINRLCGGTVSPSTLITHSVDTRWSPPPETPPFARTRAPVGAERKRFSAGRDHGLP